MKHIRPGDIVIFFLVLIASVLLTLHSLKPKGGRVFVSAAGQKYEFSLNQNQICKIPGTLGITTIQIQDNKIRIIDSPCPNKTCVHQGWGNTIVCLPNHVIVSVQEDGGFDAIAE